MDRRGIYCGGGGASAGGECARSRLAEEFAERKPRVGLIGCGWYGKTDLIRLIQVAPVEVVSLCDVDKQMLHNAADIIEGRQLSHNRPKNVCRLSGHAQGTRPGHCACRHTRPLARAAHDRRRCRRARTCTARSPSAWTLWRGRPCSPRLANTSASCRSVRSGAARPTCRKPATLSKRDAWARSAWWIRAATITCAPPTTRPIRPAPPRPGLGDCGAAPRPCVPTTPSPTHAVGGRSWSTATASWATCAFTCWT